jgi:hypothetical protein
MWWKLWLTLSNILPIQKQTLPEQLRHYAQINLIYQDIRDAVKQAKLDEALNLIKQNEHLPLNNCANDKDENKWTLLEIVIHKEDAGPLTLEILKWKVDLSKNINYYAFALLHAVHNKRTKLATMLCKHPALTIDAINAVHNTSAGDRIIHLAVQNQMEVFVKLMIPKIVDGLDLFVFNKQNETPFDEIDNNKTGSMTSKYMNVATKVWNEVGKKIEQIIYSTCEQLPTVLVQLICSYIPTRVILKSERDSENAKLNPIKQS